MGRHRRTSAAPAAAAAIPDQRAPRRRPQPARSGLLGASAAMAVGAVAVASGLIPTPQGLPGQYSFGGGDDVPGTLAQPDGLPPVAGLPNTGSPFPAPHTATATTTPTAAPSAGRSSTPVTAAPTGQPSQPVSAAGTPGPGPTADSTSAGTVGTTQGPDTGTGRGDEDGSAQPGGDDDTKGTSAAAAARQVLALVNSERAKVGCQPLTVDHKLTKLAQDFSDEMARRGFFDHTDPDGKSPWDRAALLGITDLGGENIARGQPDPEAVMASWMGSPGHRANILNCQYQTLGVGVHFDGGGPWWTQDFGF